MTPVIWRVTFPKSSGVTHPNRRHRPPRPRPPALCSNQVIAMAPPPPTLFCSECGRSTPADDLARFGDRLVCIECKAGYAQKLREGVSVASAVKFAGFWIRFVASLIDGIILFVVGSILQFAILGRQAANPFPDPNHPEAHLAESLGILGIAFLLSTVVSAVYEAVFVARLGATPGKMALSLKVVRPGGGPVSLGRAFGRYFAKVLSTFTLGIGYIIAGFDSEKRAMHDMICDTRVIQIR
jgi:uncharacterized RDD family membrane protein YckC